MRARALYRTWSERHLEVAIKSARVTDGARGPPRIHSVHFPSYINAQARISGFL